MLRLLTSRYGNWVRVGDPNQAINTTFTSADTRFLQRFLREYPEQARDLPDSGRCAQPIIDVANYLSEWSRTEHPALPADLALAPPPIRPTPPGDPQPNPEAGTPPVYIHRVALSPDKETEMVVRSLQRWLPQNGDKTVAVLAPDNQRGFALTEALDAVNLPFDDGLLRTDSATRATAEALAIVLGYIAAPQAASLLERLWTDVWYPRRLPAIVSMLSEPPPQFTIHNSQLTIKKAPLPEPIKTFGAALRQLREPEAFIFPERRDWLDGIGWLEDVDGFRALVLAFRADLQRWTRAVVLPVDELLLTLGNDLFAEPIDLALTHRLAVLLAKLGAENPTWRLPELAGELDNIAQNKRRLLGFTEDGQGYVATPGVVTVATMHAAKGLEWDRVYLLAVNRFSFPSGAEEDPYRGERWYVRDRLNLVAEAEAQLRQLHMGSLDDYRPGVATQQARLDIAAERLRLLYVGITRARRELILTYNTGRQPERDPLGPAVALEALDRFVKQ